MVGSTVLRIGARSMMYSRGFRRMSFFKDLVSYDCQSGVSAKRFVLVIAGVALSIATIVLAAAAFIGVEVEMALWAVTTPLSAMAGASYIARREDGGIISTEVRSSHEEVIHNHPHKDT